MTPGRDVKSCVFVHTVFERQIVRSCVREVLAESIVILRTVVCALLESGVYVCNNLDETD